MEVSMTETINGLHKCQPKNEPKVGQIKTFAVIHNPARNGKKAWIKIKGESPDKGGIPYHVISVTPTGWEPDDYGNIALNVELEPINPKDNDPDEIPMTHDAKGAALPAVDEAKQSAMQSANGMLIALEAARYTVIEWERRYPAKVSEEQFQAITSTFFIRMDKQGILAKLPRTPIK